MPLTISVWALFLALVTIMSRRAKAKPVISHDKAGSRLMKAQYTVFFTLLTRSLLFRARGRSRPLSLCGDAMLLTGFVAYLVSLGSFVRGYDPMVCIREGHELCTGGPYRLVRHPLYAAQMLMMLGTGLSLQNRAFLALPVAFLIMTRTARKEEEILESLYPEYAEYKARTWRFVPFVY